MKTKKVFHFIALFLIYCVGWEPLGAQNPEWEVYTCGDDITALAEEGDFLWVGTTGGLVKLNKLTGETTFFNNANSGLIYNYVNAIGVDGHANKWISSYTLGSPAFVRFDGAVWTTLDLVDGPLISLSRFVMDNKGFLWAGGNGALAKFDGEDWTTYDISQFDSSDWCPSYLISVDYIDNVWAATTEGLLRFDGTDFAHYTPSNSGLPSNVITCLKIDLTGNAWLRTQSYNQTAGKWEDDGLTKFDGTSWSHYQTPHCTNSRSLQIDNAGQIWITTDEGLARFDGSSWIVYDDTRGLNPLLCDKEGFVWLTTYEGYRGLIRFDGSNCTRFNTSNSGLHYSGVSCIAFEGSDTMWLGTRQFDNGNGFGFGFPAGALQEVTDTGWTEVQQTGLPNAHYRSIAVDDRGTKWLASSSSGLMKYDGVNITEIAVDDSGTEMAQVTSLAIDSKGDLWAGEVAGPDSDCLRRFDGTHWRKYTSTDSGFPLNSVQSLAADPEGGLWIGTFHGLVKYDATGWADYTTSNSGLPANSIDHLAVDSGGNLWIVTGASLVKFDGSKWAVEELPSPEGPYSWYITSLAIDGKGSVWLTDYSNGLLAFNGGKWTSYTTSNSGLPDNSAFCIAFDSKGNKWIGTNNGLAVFNEGGIVAVRPPTPQEQSLPRHFALSQNYPNPFNPTTTIRYELSANCFVSVKVYDILGREVKTLVSEVKKIGSYEVQFDASGLASGVYFYRIKAGNFTKTMKLMLVK